jgi:hypothetical protein
MMSQSGPASTLLVSLLLACARGPCPPAAAAAGDAPDPPLSTQQPIDEHLLRCFTSKTA